MTVFDILVPIVALALAGGAAVYARQATRRFDAKHGIPRNRHHPAE